MAQYTGRIPCMELKSGDTFKCPAEVVGIIAGIVRTSTDFSPEEKTKMSTDKKSAADEWQKERYNYSATREGNKAHDEAGALLEMAATASFEEIGQRVRGKENGEVGRLVLALVTRFEWMSGNKYPEWVRNDPVLAGMIALEEAGEELPVAVVAPGTLP